MEDTDKIEELTKYFLLKEEKYLSEINLLKEQIKLLKAALFGKKSEKSLLKTTGSSLFLIP